MTLRLCMLSTLLVLAACGDDDGFIDPDAGNDVGVDAPLDTGTDVGTDVGPGDAGADTTDAGPEGCPTFEGLGDLAGGEVQSRVVGISADGTTVVGQSQSTNGPEAMRWREADGMIGLGDLTGGAFDSLAHAVSDDGEVVVGVSTSDLVDCPGRFDEAFRWTMADGMVALGDDPAGCFFSYAYAVNGDGSTVGGGVTNALSNTAATWSTTWTDLGYAMETGNSSEVSDMTPDGSAWVGGQRVGATSDFNAYRATSAGQVLLGDLAGGAVFGSSNAISDDGTIVVGLGTSASGQEGFRWTMADGMVGLGDLAGGGFASVAKAISPDGTIIVGSGTSAAGLEATLWDGDGIELLADVLTANGITIPAGWTLSEATGVTITGGVVSIVGNGTNPDGDGEAWIARWCE